MPNLGVQFDMFIDVVNWKNLRNIKMSQLFWLLRSNKKFFSKPTHLIKICHNVTLCQSQHLPTVYNKNQMLITPKNCSVFVSFLIFFFWNLNLHVS